MNLTYFWLDYVSAARLGNVCGPRDSPQRTRCALPWTMRGSGGGRRQKQRNQRLQSSWEAMQHQVFSYFAYQRCCSGQCVDVRHVPIEPLVSFLRHPRAFCDPMLRPGSHLNWVEILSKDHLLQLWSDEQRPHSYSAGDGITSVRDTRQPRKLLFDLGASVWRHGIGGDSLKWLYNAYGQRGIRFDRIFAWEARPYLGREILDRTMPGAAYDALSYYNVPIDATPGALDNPIRTLLAVARPGDLVVWKMDFDNCTLEQNLFDQILQNKHVSMLISEFYWEHEVVDSPMRQMWQPEKNGCRETLGKSYSRYLALRALGIRAHSWV